MIGRLLFGVLTLFSLVWAEEEELENVFGHRQICGGIYGPKSNGNDRFQPQVIVSFDTRKSTNGKVGVIVYPFEDIPKLGYVATLADGRRVKKYMCDQPAAYAGECPKEDIGKFMVRDNDGGRIVSERVDINEGQPAPAIAVDVSETTYYCVAVQAVPGYESMKFDVSVKFQNPYGYLPGRDYPLILFHFVQSLVYLVISIVWTVRLIQHRHYMLRLQKHITALGYLLVLEQGFLSLYYFITNKEGASGGAKALLAVVAFWGAARLAFTFFLLLLVACGYSIVHPSLGRRMLFCRILGGVLFATSLAYFIFSYYESDKVSLSQGASVVELVLFIPMFLAFAANYFLILSWMGQTVTYLRSRKQEAKVAMYRALTTIIVFSMVALIAMLACMILAYMFWDVTKVLNKSWQLEWIISDGWPNIVFCVAFVCVMILWRPNSDNKRYAMSTQLAQNEADAEEFEIGSLDGSEDEGMEYGGDETNLGAQPGSSRKQDMEFDTSQNHGLSDLEDEFEIDVEQSHAIVNDEDPLVDAPSTMLNKKSR